MPRRWRYGEGKALLESVAGPRKRGRPPGARNNDGRYHDDDGPIIAMWVIARDSGERSGGLLARYAYKVARHDPHFADLFEHADLKATPESVIRRWARRWNALTADDAVRKRLDEQAKGTI